MTTADDILGSAGVTDPGSDRKPCTSWRPVDLSSVLDGTHKQPVPTVGARDDGVGMFYPGRLHTVSSETEGGKTWLLLWTAVQELAKGNHVVHIDPEDDHVGTVGRLLLLGAKADDIRERFHYIRPEEALTDVARGELHQLLMDTKPTFSVLDGVTEAMVMHGLNPLDNADCAKFGRILPRPIASYGSAMVAADHVTKSSEGRGRYSIGAVHKLNGLNGAAYTLENRVAFGVGRTGRSTLLIAKDRPGQLRRHAFPTNAPGVEWFSDFSMESLDGFNDVSLTVPVPARDEEGNFRPTVLMVKVCETLDSKPGLSKTAIETMTPGKAAHIRTALELLVRDGYVTEQPRKGRGGGTAYTKVRDYDPEEGEYR
ncbi:DNA primase [Streptomyces europaeiscabiei]|uniref:DNA primase n=1 Tax=Streptomyces europaeiscabiei TaxID=146819 RepID=UPI0030E07C20